MVSELSVIIKDDEKRLTKDFLEYEVFTVDENDPVIQRVLKETLDNFDGEPSDIDIKIKMKIQ